MSNYPTLIIRVTPDLHDMLREESYRTRTPVAELVRQSIAARYGQAAAEPIITRHKPKEKGG